MVNLNILIGVTGSVATIKLIDLIEEIKSSPIGRETNLCFRVIQTQNSKRFVSKDSLNKHFNNRVESFDDEDEWKLWDRISDPVLHIELRRWAHVLIVAPLDANTMAKVAHGICDNLLTCIIRAWDMSKPLIYCPAMNTLMYEHPLTEEHLAKLDSLGYVRVDCVSKKLACGDVGLGAMASVDTIATKVIQCLTPIPSSDADTE